MICFIAMAVFAVLSIFSAKYRPYARASFDCVFRRLTLRPCNTGMDEKIKAEILAILLKRSPPLAKFTNIHFEAISWFFTILFFASLAYSIFSLYNWVAYGNCNGPNSNAFCVFDAIASNPSRTLSSPAGIGVGPRLGSGKTTLIEYGCFSCPYTKQAQPILKQFLASHPEITLEFRAYPIQTHQYSFLAAQGAFCADEQSKFWQYHDMLFANSDHSPQNLNSMAGAIGLDMSKFSSCMATNSTTAAKKVIADEKEGQELGIYGTPTFFLNGKSLVGPASVSDFEALLRGEQQSPTQAPATCTVQNKSG